nr:MAG TPA: hypothetical protein [Caudoviricetes sp.]
MRFKAPFLRFKRLFFFLLLLHYFCFNRLL